jgi:hypothetical protein
MSPPFLHDPEVLVILAAIVSIVLVALASAPW